MFGWALAAMRLTHVRHGFMEERFDAIVVN
jgi:hypothetical protein